MRTVISLKELMERWDLSRTTIMKMEQDGRLKRLKLPGIYYPMKAVLELEGLDPAEWSKSPFEWRRLKDELESTKKELVACRETLNQFSAILAKYNYEEAAKNGR